MISVTIEQNGHTVGRLEIRRTGRLAQFEASFSDFAADGSPDHMKRMYFNFLDDWPEAVTMKLVTKSMLELFPSVMAQAGRETARETIRGGDPEDNIAYSHEHALPGQIFFFNDTHKGRRTAIFDLMLKVAKLEKEMKDLKLSVWLADKRLINIEEHQRFKELDRKTETDNNDFEERLSKLEKDEHRHYCSFGNQIRELRECVGTFMDAIGGKKLGFPDSPPGILGSSFRLVDRLLRLESAQFTPYERHILRKVISDKIKEKQQCAQ